MTYGAGETYQSRRVSTGDGRASTYADTSTTGASSLEAVGAARAGGAAVVAVATIADRATGAAERFAEAGLDYRFVFGLDELGLA